MKYTNYTNFWLHDLELTSRITREVAKKFFETNSFPINLDEYIILDTLLNNEKLLQMKLAKILNMRIYWTLLQRKDNKE